MLRKSGGAAAVLCCVVLFVVCRPVFAGVQVYTDPAQYAAATAGLSGEIIVDFESETPGSLIADGGKLGNITFNYDLGGPELTIADFFDAVSGANMLGADKIFGLFFTPDGFSMQFDEPVQAVGLYIVTEPFITLAPNSLTLTAGGVTVQTVSSPTVVLPDLGWGFFLGLVADTQQEAFSTAVFESTTPSGGNFTFNIDDISTFPVPAPAAPVPVDLIVPLTLLAGLSFLARKRLKKS